MNSTVEEDLRSSFDMYDPHSTLGSHLAPGSSFIDNHDVHYQTGNVSYAPNVHTNATIHSATAAGYNYDYATQSTTNEWNRVSLASSQGPPGYPNSNIGGSSIKTNPQLLPESSMSTTTPADSVLELKRGLKNQSPATTSTSEDGSSRGSSSGMSILTFLTPTQRRHEIFRNYFELLNTKNI